MACPDRLDRALSLLLPPAFWLGVWQLGAWLVELHVEGRGNELLLPYPATVLLALFRLARSPEFWWTALASLARIAAGMAGGAVLGGLLAALTCASPWCRRLFAPVIRIVRATPVVSFILLVLLWTGRDQVPAVIAGLMVLPVVWENLTQGIRATDGQLLELARAYRFSRWKTVRLVYLPCAPPPPPPWGWPGNPAWPPRSCASPGWASAPRSAGPSRPSKLRTSSPGRRWSSCSACSWSGR